MYIDANLLFSHEQALTATSASTKSLKLDSCIGSGTPIYPVISVVEEFTGLTSLKVDIQSTKEGDTSPDSDATWETILSSGVLTAAELKEIQTINFGSLPPQSDKFLRVYYTVVGTPTKGKVTAALVLDRQG